MAHEMTFKLSATINGDTQEFVLRTNELQAVLESLPGDATAFAGFYSAVSAHPSARVRMAAAHKECLPTDAVMELARDRSVEVRRALVHNPLFRRFASDETLLRLISADPEFAESVIEYLDKFESADVDVIGEALLSDTDTNIRQRLASNYNTPVRLLKKLTKDSASEVVEAARNNIAERHR